MKTAKYKVHEIEERTGIPATTLRQWERRYDFPKPERSASGYRLYSDSDLQHIQMMQRHIRDGISASQAAELVKTSVLNQHHARSLEQIRYELLQALCNFHEESANRVLGEAYSLYPVDDVMFEVIEHTMVRIGQMWHDSKITVATEHFASSYILGKLRSLLNTSPNLEDALAVIVSCAPHEHHEIGALMLAIRLRRSGYRVYYLGANMPIVDLRQFSYDIRASAVMLSASTKESFVRLEHDKALLQGIAPVLALGGWVFDAQPRLAADLGGMYLGGSLRDVHHALKQALQKITAQQKSTQRMLEHLSNPNPTASPMANAMQPLRASGGKDAKEKGL